MAVFRQEKREKNQPSQSAMLANNSELSKTWEEYPKKSDVFRKMSEKKRKTLDIFQENSNVFLVPFGEGCESKKCKIAVMRAREEGTDEK